MRALLLLCLLSSLASAQVAGLCGTGKDCNVRSVRTTRTGTGTSAAVKLVHAGGSLAFCDSSNNCNWLQCNNSAAAGLICTSGGGGASITSASWIDAATGYTAASAFASFPAAASSSGRLLYDSTNSVWRYSTGTSWQPVGPYNLSDEFVIYFPGIAGLLNLPVSRWLAPRNIWNGGSVVGAFALQIYSATTLVAGVGAGNAVFTIHNVTDGAATTATLTVPCASTAGTVTSQGSIDSSVSITTSGKLFELRLTTNGCSTLPILNLNVRYSVSPPTN